MSFYNLALDKYNLILTIQPKCGCNTILQWVKDNDRSPDECKILPQQVLADRFRSYEKVLVIRNLYDRLISYYSLFVIDPGNQYKGLWEHADKVKTINLRNTSFAEFIHIMKDLLPEEYQHHLVPQTYGIDVNSYDRIVNIKRLNRYLESKSLPLAGWKNEIKRINYQRSVIHDSPVEMSKIGAPAEHCFYDKDLVEITHTYIYPNDYRLLKDYFV